MQLHESKIILKQKVQNPKVTVLDWNCKELAVFKKSIKQMTSNEIDKEKREIIDNIWKKKGGLTTIQSIQQERKLDGLMMG